MVPIELNSLITRRSNKNKGNCFSQEKDDRKLEHRLLLEGINQGWIEYGRRLLKNRDTSQGVSEGSQDSNRVSRGILNSEEKGRTRPVPDHSSKGQCKDKNLVAKTETTEINSICPLTKTFW